MLLLITLITVCPGIKAISPCTGKARLAGGYDPTDSLSGNEPITIIWGFTGNMSFPGFVAANITVTSLTDDGATVTALDSTSSTLMSNITSTKVIVPSTKLNYMIQITNQDLGLSCTLELIPLPQYVRKRDPPTESLMIGLAGLLTSIFCWFIF